MFYAFSISTAELKKRIEKIEKKKNWTNWKKKGYMKIGTIKKNCWVTPYMKFLGFSHQSA